MHYRPPTIASVIRTVTAAAAMLGLQGCNPFPARGWQPATSIHLGVSSDLQAVFAIGGVSAVGKLSIAVGRDGTIVVWRDNRVVSTSSITDVELRAVTKAGAGPWVVVGDGGFAAQSDDWGQTWTTLDLQTSADLHDVLAVGESVVVVGDEVVRVLEDGAWLEPPTPTGGWGQLRGVGSTLGSGTTRRVFAVGRGGVIWSSDDPSGAWVAEDSGVSVDLFAVGGVALLVEGMAAVGATGTFLIREEGEWRGIETDRTVDLLDYQDFFWYGLLLAADGEILQYHLDDGFQFLDRFEGARDLGVPQDLYEGKISPTTEGLIAVGESGMAVSKALVFCPEE